MRTSRSSEIGRSKWAAEAKYVCTRGTMTDSYRQRIVADASRPTATLRFSVSGCVWLLLHCSDTNRNDDATVSAARVQSLGVSQRTRTDDGRATGIRI